MDVTSFISNIPATTRERESVIKNAINNNTVYVTAISKNKKMHFKIYYKNGDAIKTVQLKISDGSIAYIKNNMDVVTLSDTAKQYIK